MKTSLSIMTALLYLCLNSVFASEPGLRPFIASYRISHLGVPVGHAQMQLSYPSAGFYQIDFSIQPNTVAAWMGVNRIVESSQGEISQNQIVPQQYHYHLLDTAEHPVKSIKVVFDRKKKRVITHINTDHWSMSIPAHTQDKLSVRIAMLMRLSNDQRNGRLPVADGGKLKYYQFHDQGSSLLQTLIGSYPAIKLELRKPGEARPTYSWVAETLDYIPLRIERPVKEHYLLLELESLEFQDLGKVTPR